MKYRYLGNSGLAVSTVCLGTATFGQKEWGCNKDVSIQILNHFVEQGGNFIDTADQYADTFSEQIIGEWLNTQKRDELVIATKCFFQTGKDINSRGLSRKHIISACESSLKRLQTDYIDLYQIHNQDPQTPLEETLSALDFLIKQGKVRYIGLSNHPAWKIVKASYISQIKGHPNFISGQFLYNLLKRDIEVEILPACRDFGIGVLCWSPLSGGMLTGKYVNKDKPEEGTRLDSRKDVVKDRYGEWYKKSEATVNRLKEIASKNNVSPAIVSLAWLLKNRIVTSTILGATSLFQITDNIKAAEWFISEEDWESLNKISKINFGYPNDVFETTTKGWFNNIG